MVDVLSKLDKNPGEIGQGDTGSKKKRRGRKTREQRYKEKKPRPDYTPIVKDNENLVKYYKLQSIFEEGEFDDFMQGLRETLPASFRINTFDIDQSKFLRQLVQGPELEEFLAAPKVTSQKVDDCNDEAKNDGEEIDDAKRMRLKSKPPVLEPLNWYPSRLAWQMNITRLDLKKSPVLQQFHRFLMAETDNGFISRQEAVSMIPPLVLDVQCNQNILDMCAAPGSKTAQLLEYLKSDISKLTPAQGSDSKPFDEGIVVANDVDNKRCYMLVHQSSRLNSPNCVIINQDAGKLPKMKTIDPATGNYIDIKFDRILCDVPCSGDGTVRKNPDVWKKWSVGNANNFHGMQLKILRRGVELLKENGQLVYSTCSMNPIEDEAVIASILRASQGRLVLEDASHKLPGLKYRPGTSTWVVMNREMDVIPNVDAVPASNATQIYPSLFPPTEEESKTFKLNKCLRVLPHLQNTGGFFVALLRKTAPTLPWEEIEKAPRSPKATIEVQPDSQSAADRAKPKKRRFGGFKEDPFIFMDPDDPDWVSIKSVYGLSDEFPVDQLVHRCTSGKKRSIYLMSKRTRDFIVANREEPGRRDFVKVINGGMRLFSRADTEAGFRICQDGVSEVLPYLKGDVKAPVSKEDLIALLKGRTVAHEAMSEGQRIKDVIRPGSFVLTYYYTTETGEKSILPLVAWKGEYTIALYVSKTYRVHLCALVQLKITDDGALNENNTAEEQ